MIPNFYKLKNYYWNIRNFFSPRQKWLTKEIPNRWMDKPELIWLILLECLKNYCKKEIGLDNLRNPKYDKDYPEYQRKFEHELLIIYEKVIYDLPVLEKQLEKEWDKIPCDFTLPIKMTTEECNKKYFMVNKLEKQINDLKTEILLWIVSNRGYLWS